MSRQRKLFLAAGLAVLAYGAMVHAAEPEITVYKSPTCGCCTKWVDHLKENGLEVESVDVRDPKPPPTHLSRTALYRHTADAREPIVELGRGRP
jgi:hypothetical protein